MPRSIAKDHAEKRSHILKIAARIFADQGFARASMSLVARECGTSKANIYHYYDSKDALLFDILDSYLSSLRDRVLGLPIEDLAPAAQLERVILEFLIAYEGMDYVHKVQTEGIALLDKDRQEILKDYQRELVRHLGAVISKTAPMVFSEEPDKLRPTVMSVFGMINWFYMWNGSAGKKARQDYAGFVTKLALNGVHGL